MDPILLASLVSLGIEAVESVPTKDEVAVKERNYEELERLLSMEKANKLGLSGPEQYALLQSQAEGMGVSRQAADAATRNALAGAGAGFGSGQMAAQAAQAEQARLAAAGRNEVVALDRQKVAAQKQEIEERLAFAASSSAEQKAKNVEVAKTGADAFAQQSQFNQTTGTNSLGSAQQRSYQQYISLGYSPEAAANMSTLSPDAQASLGYFMGSDSAPQFGSYSSTGYFMGSDSAPQFGSYSSTRY